MVNVNKELAIQHFKSKYNCTWEEFEDNSIQITISYGRKQEKFFIDFNMKSKHFHFFEDKELNETEIYTSDIKVNLDLVEDLISILHLYYIK